jgi:hypothetical protein
VALRREFSCSGGVVSVQDGWFVGHEQSAHRFCCAGSDDAAVNAGHPHLLPKCQVEVGDVAGAEGLGVPPDGTDVEVIHEAVGARSARVVMIARTAGSR